MERIQGQNKLCVNILDQKVNVKRSIQVQRSILEEEEQFTTPSLEDTTIPFLQMLPQSEDQDPSSYSSFKDTNILALLSLQTLEKPWELEVPEFYSHSPIHSETNHYYYQNPSLEGGLNEAISSQELPLNSIDNANTRRKRKNNNLATTSMITKEKRKRRRTKQTKNIEEMETQRMTHIAVERNRRRQMNVHLNSLRSLIPPSYIPRGDQASIVGGAIDFVKNLEQHLQSLEAQKITKQSETDRDILRATEEEEVKIDATVIESHVNLKIQCLRKQGQLLRTIILLEKLRFSVLHLNITSPSNTLVSYSFNLKMEDDCVLESADEIRTMVRQIFDEI
ncbi:hypothetical protein AALP_AA4G257800 [Arabis alpina]|uniref:BHLH domain-containing protein n=1 Tax=Arabis alpina TaxID=50452 RepID=A0A087H5P3_ARAAL|nr:hypothetical protein AALP_AA4G257800 [Arabis alpina]